MRTILFTLFILLPLSIFSQSYQPGEITYTNGKIVSGLIEYNNPIYTPQSFNFKESKNAKATKVYAHEINAVVIPEYAKFIKKEIQISYHSNNLDKLDTFKNFNLSNETKIIEVLTEGKYNLYKYEDDKTEMFYYSEGDQPIKTLLYKKYYTDEIHYMAAEEKIYLTDLQSINCANINLNFVKYSVTSLENFFKKTNKCNENSTNAINEIKSKNRSFQKNKVTASYSFFTENKDIKAFDLGYEWENFLPYYNYSFSFSFTPYFRYYQNPETKKEITNYSVELPLLLKFYPIKSDSFKLYLGYSIFNFRYYNFTYYTFENDKYTKSHFTAFENTFFESGIVVKNFEVYSKYYFNALSQYDSKNFSIGVKYNFKTNKKN